MQASFNININDYLSTSEIEEMVRDEVRYYISDGVRRALNTVSFADMIHGAARKQVVEIIENEGIDLYQKVADKTLECIDELSLYYILRNIDDETKSAGQVVLDECVEEARPKIQQKVNEIIEDKLNADWLVDCVVDDFYSRLRDQLMGK